MPSPGTTATRSTRLVGMGSVPFWFVFSQEERHSSREKRRAPWAWPEAGGLQAVLRAAKNPPALIGNQLNTESLGQAAASFGRQPQRAGIAHAGEPSALEAAAANLGADETREMVAPLAPIEARPAIDAAALRFRQGRGTEALKQPGTAVGQLAAIVADDHVPCGLQSIGDGDAERARDVIVAGTGKA